MLPACSADGMTSYPLLSACTVEAPARHLARVIRSVASVNDTVHGDMSVYLGFWDMHLAAQKRWRKAQDQKLHIYLGLGSESKINGQTQTSRWATDAQD